MYVNGSDLLIALASKALGHNTSHTINYDTETKEHAVKPVESALPSASKFKETTVTGLSITISFQGLVCSDESETHIGILKDLWYKGEPVDVESFARKKSAGESARNPNLKAKFIITKLTEDAPAEDDTTYSGELKMTGAPEVWEPEEYGPATEP